MIAAITALYFIGNLCLVVGFCRYNGWVIKPEVLVGIVLFLLFGVPMVVVSKTKHAFKNKR